MTPDHGQSLGLFKAIKKALLSIRISFETLKHDCQSPSLICANFDDASVMQGWKNGGHILNTIH